MIKKCQSKIAVSVWNPIGGFDHILKVGSMYECELTPTIYDPVTLNPDKPSYVVACEDGKFRKYYAEHFKDIQEVREEKLKELGI
jgi:hypothetical protein